jgi:hypothetical protein
MKVKTEKGKSDILLEPEDEMEVFHLGLVAARLWHESIKWRMVCNEKKLEQFVIEFSDLWAFLIKCGWQKGQGTDAATTTHN